MFSRHRSAIEKREQIHIASIKILDKISAKRNRHFQNFIRRRRPVRPDCPPRFIRYDSTPKVFTGNPRKRRSHLSPYHGKRFSIRALRFGFTDTYYGSEAIPKTRADFLCNHFVRFSEKFSPLAMSDNRIRNTKINKRSRRHHPCKSASILPKYILRPKENSFRKFLLEQLQKRKRRTHNELRTLPLHIPHLFRERRAILGIFLFRHQLHLQIGNQIFHILQSCSRKNSAAFSGSMAEISIPVESSKPAHVEVCGRISICQP